MIIYFVLSVWGNEKMEQFWDLWTIELNKIWKSRNNGNKTLWSVYGKCVIFMSGGMKQLTIHFFFIFLSGFWCYFLTEVRVLSIDSNTSNNHIFHLFNSKSFYCHIFHSNWKKSIIFIDVRLHISFAWFYFIIILKQKLFFIYNYFSTQSNNRTFIAIDK